MSTRRRSRRRRAWARRQKSPACGPDAGDSQCHSVCGLIIFRVGQRPPRHRTTVVAVANSDGTPPTISTSPPRLAAFRGRARMMSACATKALSSTRRRNRNPSDWGFRLNPLKTRAMRGNAMGHGASPHFPGSIKQPGQHLQRRIQAAGQSGRNTNTGSQGTSSRYGGTNSLEGETDRTR
jgi:hypothetical protein